MLYLITLFFLFLAYLIAVVAVLVGVVAFLTETFAAIALGFAGICVASVLLALLYRWKDYAKPQAGFEAMMQINSLLTPNSPG